MGDVGDVGDVGDQPDGAIEAFVAAARAATGLASERFDVFAFGDSAAMADELAALVLADPKRATAGLLAASEADGEPLPAEGGLSVVVDGAGRPVALIQTVEVTVRPFRDVDARFAHDEGEGDRSLRYWREAHRAFFARTGPEFTEDSPIVCERFELIYPQPAEPR